MHNVYKVIDILSCITNILLEKDVFQLMVFNKIIKNTVFLYIRTFVLMILTLINTSLLLRYLGEVDFGVYSLITSIILLFSFINNSITTSVQRFLNVSFFDHKVVKEIYSVCVIIFLIIAFLVCIVLIFFRDDIILNLLNIPIEKLSLASNIYLVVAFSFFFNFMSLLYYSCLISYEDFSGYAKISIFEGVLKLLFVFVIPFFEEGLIFYSLMLFIISFSIFFILVFYSYKTISFCKFRFYKKSKYYIKIFRFILWNLFGSLGVIATHQGVPVVANIFYGVVVNGSLNICAQINSMIMTLTGNFQKAFLPGLMKSFSKNENLLKDIISLSRLSIFFFCILAIPIYFYIDDILLLWLGSIPEYVSEIVKISVLILLLEVLSGPLWMLIQASGNIKRYQICVFVTMSMNVPLSYFMLKLGYELYDVWYGILVINLMLFIVRLYFVSFLIKKEVILFINI